MTVRVAEERPDQRRYVQPNSGLGLWLIGSHNVYYVKLRVARRMSVVPPLPGELCRVCELS